jgi:HEPN domain-containing protein
MVCFHAQQAVEKSLKAVLALYDIDYPWRHDLGELMELVKPTAPEIALYEDGIIEMAPYAVTIRYDTEFEPSTAQANDALATAENVYKIVDAIINSGFYNT